MKKPNVILIVLDCARAMNFSCYGYSRKTTPHLDDFCSESNLFRNAFTPAIWTIPSHASMFTGTYPSTHGALNLSRVLDARHITLSELLSSQGCDAVAYANNGFISLKDFGLSRGFTAVAGFDSRAGKMQKALKKGWRLMRGYNDAGAYVTNQFVRQWLRQQRDPRKPFFLFLNYMEAHAPYKHVPRKFLKMHVGKAERTALKSINQDRQKYLTRSIEMTEPDFEILRSVYDAQISYLDFMMHDLFGILKSARIMDDSIVIITSDHGDLIGEHNLVHHSYSVHEELIKVPLIVKLPGRLDNGKEHDQLASLVDIFPTVMDLLQISDENVARQLQGENLFSSDDPASREYVFAECERPKNEFAETYPDFDFSVYDRQLLSIRSKKYKYIWTSDNCPELYDLENDPRERNNLREEMPLLARQLEEKLLDWYKSCERDSGQFEAHEVELDTEVKERLQALGYF